MNLGYPRPKRIDLLERLSKAIPADATYENIPFQGKNQRYPIHTLPIDAPKYRLANGRTQAMQEEYLATNKLSADFFSSDPESDAAQKVQHGFLEKLIEEEDLFSYFKDNEQNEPLILTHDGFIVNGNRRLCAMRKHFYSDQAKYSRFSHFTAMILPVCTDKDIDALEADLQIKRDIKADYTWITKACMLRKKLLMGYTQPELIKMYGLKEKAVQDSLALLTDADAYLTSIGKGKMYHLVEDDEFAFKKIYENRQKIRGEVEKAIFAKIAYVLVENKELIPDRLYKVIPEIKEQLPNILKRLEEELPKEAVPAAAPAAKIDLLGGTASPYKPIELAIANAANKDTVLSVARDVVERARIVSKEKHRADFPLECIKKAHSFLNEALTTFGKDSTTTGIEAQLKSVEQAIKNIRERLTKNVS